MAGKKTQLILKEHLEDFQIMMTGIRTRFMILEKKLSLSMDAGLILRAKPLDAVIGYDLNRNHRDGVNLRSCHIIRFAALVSLCR